MLFYVDMWDQSGKFNGLIPSMRACWQHADTIERSRSGKKSKLRVGMLSMSSKLLLRSELLLGLHGSMVCSLLPAQLMVQFTLSKEREMTHGYNQHIRVMMVVLMQLVGVPQQNQVCLVMNILAPKLILHQEHLFYHLKDSSAEDAMAKSNFGTSRRINL